MLTFKIFGVEIDLCFGFFFILGLSVLRDNSLGGAALLFCVLHELSHLFFMRIFGVKISSVRFYGGGIKISSSGIDGLSRGKAAAVYLSGAAMNLMLGAVLKGEFRGINLALGAFNLLPIGYFDGGRFAALFLSERAARALSVISGAALLAGFAGFLYAAPARASASAVMSMGFILISLFLDA